MNVPRIFATALIATLLSSSAFYAAEAQVVEHPVQMVSGGVGEAGMDDITAVQKHYSLKLIFAETNGDYLADVGVLIRNHKGDVVVNTDSQGPVVLINLEPGAYTVVSTVTGESKTQRVVVHGSGLNTYYIHLHSAES
jgi:hypothetical protein